MLSSYNGPCPSNTLSIALQQNRFSASSKKAFDLGCGSGLDTLELLKNGWDVTAVDSDKNIIRQLNNQLKPQYEKQLVSMVCQFEEMEFTPVDLVNASLALPYCDPYSFLTVWTAIVNALKENGYFSGHFFGPLDYRAKSKSMTFCSKGELIQLLDKLEIVYFEETQNLGLMLSAVPKCFHIYHVVARKK